MTGQERDLRGQHMVFFGGSSGIGQAAMIEVARRAAMVAVVGRNRTAGEEAARLAQEAGAASATFIQGDLSTLSGVAGAADAVAAWSPKIDAIVHTAMSPFNKFQLTADGFEFSFALQHFARAALNRLLSSNLAASQDARVINVIAQMPLFLKPNVDDVNYETRKWGFFKSVLSAHLLSALHVAEAQRRWADYPITLLQVGAPTAKTHIMMDSSMDWRMRLLGRFGKSAAVAAQGVTVALLRPDIRDAGGKELPSPAKWKILERQLDHGQASKLWHLSTALAASRGVTLPEGPTPRA